MFLNPEMISFLAKTKLDEIINGIIPEGFELKSKENNKIILKFSKAEPLEGITINNFNISFTYNNHEIICSND